VNFSSVSFDDEYRMWFILDEVTTPIG